MPYYVVIRCRRGYVTLPCSLEIFLPAGTYIRIPRDCSVLAIDT